MRHYCLSQYHENAGENPDNIMIGGRRNTEKPTNHIQRMDSLMQAVEVLLERKPTVEIMVRQIDKEKEREKKI